ARRAESWTAASRPEKAIVAWQQVIEDDRLRQYAWPNCDGGRAAELVALRQIKDLIRAHGTELYELNEQRARTMFAGAKKSGRADAILQTARRFPFAQATTEALTELATTHAHRPGIA